LPRQVNALAVDPANPQAIYAGTGSSGAGSGVYKSEDAGRTWQLASNGLPKEDVRALAFSRGSPPTLYAQSALEATSLPASTGRKAGPAWATMVDRVQRRLVVAPGNADLLFAAEDVRGAYRSLDGGHNWLPANQGLPKDDNGSHNVQSLAIDPTDRASSTRELVGDRLAATASINPPMAARTGRRPIGDD